MTLDQKLKQASDDARARVQCLDVPPLRSGGSSVMSRLRTTMTKRGREMRNRPVLVFAGAVLAVVLVVGFTAVLQARSEDPLTSPPPTADTVTTTAPSTTPAPQATPPDLDAQREDVSMAGNLCGHLRRAFRNHDHDAQRMGAARGALQWCGQVPIRPPTWGSWRWTTCYADPCAVELGMLDPAARCHRRRPRRRPRRPPRNRNDRTQGRDGRRLRRQVHRTQRNA